MSRLLLLLHELLDKIVSHLLTSQDILHLPLTCKDLHIKTTERPYESITFLWIHIFGDRLTTLRLRETTVTLDMLSKLLACTLALESLEYEYCIAHGQSVPCRHLTEAFGLVKSTFEHLKFTCWIKEETGNESALADGMCHIQDFPLLTCLSISPVFLLGSDLFLAPRIEGVMPPSLRKLCFTDDLPGNSWGAEVIMEAITEAITDVCFDFVEGVWGASAPVLKKVYVANDIEGLNGTEEAYLWDLCRDNGLEYGM
jgi:hypothetical protein